VIGERFELGQTVATPGALQACEDANVSPSSLLARHQRGDWGDLCEADRRENERSLRFGWRLLSSYPLGSPGEAGAIVWCISEADRSSTCLLLPSEY